MIRFRFEPGQTYVAVPTLGGARRIVAAVRDRTARHVTFAEIHEVARCEVETMDGRETCRIRSGCGVDYFVSAASVVDVASAVETMGMLGR